MLRRTRRVRNRATEFVLCITLALCAWGAIAPRVHADTQSCTFNIGGVEIDGNLVTDTPGNLDWFLPTGGAVGDAFLQRGSAPCGLPYSNASFDPLRLIPISLHKMERDDCNAAGSKDRTVFGSTSDKNNSCLVTGLTPWQCKTGDVPQKNDLTEAYAVVFRDTRTLVNGAPNPTLNHLFLFIAVSHRSTDGDNHLDFEFNQQGLSECINGVITGPSPQTDLTGGRTVGDFIVSLDFVGGGNNAEPEIRLWKADAGAPCGYSFQPVDPNLGPLGQACTNNDEATDPHDKNDVTISAPCDALQPSPQCEFDDIYHENQYIETAVDLTAAGIESQLICGANSSLMIKSRSSQEFTAELKDFIKFPFQILQPPVLTPTGGTACAGGSVQLCANPVGGSPPYGFTWSNGAGNTNCVTVSPGSSTTYTVTVTDSEGCSVTGTATATINPNPAAAVPDLEVCAGGSREFCANATLGTPPYTYAWNTGETTACVTKSAAGTYTVTVTDSKSCTAIDSGTLTVNPNPIAAVPDLEVCAGGSREFCANASSGTGPYTYAWNTGETTACITKSVAGTYTVTVTDSKGCTGTDSGSLTINPNPSAAVPDLEACSGESREFCANASGGTGPYTYVWNTGETTACVTKSDAGTYTVTVTDSKSCTAIDSGTLTINPGPSAAVPDLEVCQGGSREFCANASGGTGPYTYAWNTGETTACVTKSAAGTYTVTVTDSKGCTATDSGTLTVNPNPTAAVPDLETCQDGSQEFCANASGGTGPYTYAWNTGETTACVTKSAAGTYTVTVTDSKGCTGTDSGTLTVHPNLTVAVPNLEVCDGGSREFCANASGGTGPYTYVWSTGETTACVTKSAAGTYTVTVTDTKGCIGSDSGTLTINPNPSAAVPDLDVCAGGSREFCANASGGTGPYTYLWSTGETTACVTKSAAGTYTVTVTDSKGCTAIDGGTLTINPDPTVSVNSGTFCPSTGTFQLCATATPPSGATIATYAWSNGGNTQCINVTAGGTYTVTVTDSRGCTATASGTATESCPNGCTPGFWCGGPGSNGNGNSMWNTVNDPQWPGPDGSCGGQNPFIHTDLFNSFFAPHSQLNGKTMIALLCTGGGGNPVEKAARDVIAACLNACSGIGYKYTCDEVKTLWQGALNGTGPFNLAQLHNELGGLNQGGCPFGQVSGTAAEVEPQSTDQAASTPATPGSDLDGLDLYRPMPNPFASSTRVIFAVPSGGAGVDVGVFDLAGRRVQTLASGVMSGGRHSTTWNGLDEAGVRVKNGMYFIHTSIAGQRRTISVVLLR